jgi:hypothetical protein
LQVASGRAALVALLVAPVVFSGCADLWSEPRAIVVSGGVIGAARTDRGSGSGWAVRAGPVSGENTCSAYGARILFSDVEYDDETVRGASLEVHLPLDFLDVSLGWGYHWDESDGWGTGPSVGGGVFWLPTRRLAIGLEARAYFWMGSDGDDFDAGLEGDASVELRLSF